MKLRNLFFIAAFLVFASAIALMNLPFFQQSVSYLEVPLIALDAAAVQTISIQQAGEELILTKDSDKWLSTNGQWSNQLDKERVEALLACLQSVKSTGIVGQRAEEWPQFNQVTPHVYYIRLYDRTQLLESFYLSAAGRVDTLLEKAVFLRLPNTNLVYEVPARIGELWLQPLGLYRDRQLLIFDPAAVRGIRIEEPSMEPLQMVLRDSIWQDSTGRTYADTLFRSWLLGISNLQGQSYAERFNEVEQRGLPKTSYTFSIENQGPIRLEIFADSNQVAYPFVIRSNQFPGRYFKSDSTGLYQNLKFLTDGRFNSGL